ncbi:MAG: hypothetical protein IKC71_04095 [Clostridia bacterium]|nr:hypothetical protein [Clostridia bacterium]
MKKNLPKCLRICAIAEMSAFCLVALCYAIYLLTWGFYLGAVLVVVASGLFVVIGLALFGLAKVVENTNKLVELAKKEEEK